MTLRHDSNQKKGREHSPEVVRCVGRGESLPVEECLGARHKIEAVIAWGDLLARRGVDFAEADLSRKAERERAMIRSRRPSGAQEEDTGAKPKRSKKEARR